ncbi:porin family protein [Lewinella sp. LCG006]|uniref:porin family protein n=1 Tax=Lewinella sp. LCG006 TaxID=3231911 RepID=UPI0034613E6E
MKKNFILLTLLCLSALGTVYGQARFGLKGGLTLANVNFSGDDVALETDMKTTFHVGPVAEFGVAPYVKINTGLLLTGRGYGYGFEILGTSVDIDNTIWYLQIPVNILYEADLFYFSAGPYFAFGVGGNADDGEEKTDIEFGNTEDDELSPSDVGLNVELGVNLPNLRLGVGYGLGLSNNIPKDLQSGDAKVTNNAINVSATYFFGGY